MHPIAQSDGRDVPGLFDERVSGIAVRKPVVAHELPDVFLRIWFRAFRWQGDEGDGVRHHEAFRHVQSA